jgi:hypothetical protein
MGWTLTVVLAVDLVVLAGFWLLMRRWIARRLAAPRQAADLGDEVGRLVTELNQAAERNVMLLEDRMTALNDLLAAADKKIGLLRREIERHETGAGVYGRLATPGIRTAAATAASDRPGGERAPAGAAAPAAAAPRVGTDERPAVANANPAAADGRQAGPVDEKPAAPDPRTLMRTEIGRLARAGLEASAIAARVGAPLGEVELILWLEQRARGS